MTSKSNSDAEATSSGRSSDRRISRQERKRRARLPKALIETSGPNPGAAIENVMLTVGVVAGSHGVDGELKVLPHTDNVELFFEQDEIWIGSEREPRSITRARLHKGFVLLCLTGIESPEECNHRRGQRLRIPASATEPLQKDEFFLFQLIGLRVFDEQGSNLGLVADVMETGAREVFVIRSDDRKSDILLPNIPETILEIDPPSTRMVVRLLQYLDDESPGN